MQPNKPSQRNRSKRCHSRQTSALDQRHGPTLGAPRSSQSQNGSRLLVHTTYTFRHHNTLPQRVDQTGEMSLLVRDWWQVLDSNQRRLSRRFYRPLPLAARATCRGPWTTTTPVKDSRGRGPYENWRHGDRQQRSERANRSVSGGRTFEWTSPLG